VTKLDVGRADVIADWNSEKAPFAVHWITHVCPKPWLVADAPDLMESHCDPVVYSYWQRIWDRLTASSTDSSTAQTFGSREAARRKLRRLTGVSAGASIVGKSHKRYESVNEMLVDLRDSVGRQLRQLTMSRRELRRRRYEYDAPWSEGTWAWIAIIGTLALGLGAGALLHKLFIKAPTEVGKGMTVVQAKRMGFQALGEGKGPVGVVSAVDDDDDDEDEEDEEDEKPKPKK
jgi:glycogenin glucosyltransferase